MRRTKNSEKYCHGQSRIKDAFLWLPIELPLEFYPSTQQTRWLERAIWKEVYSSAYGWIKMYWIDDA